MTSSPMLFSLPISKSLYPNFDANYRFGKALGIEKKFEYFPESMEHFACITDGNKIFIDELLFYEWSSIPKLYYDLSGDMTFSYFFALPDIFSRFNVIQLPTLLNGFELTSKEDHDLQFFCVDANQIKKMNLDDLEQEMFHYIRKEYKGVQGPYYYHEIATTIEFLRKTKELEEDAFWTEGGPFFERRNSIPRK